MAKTYTPDDIKRIKLRRRSGVRFVTAIVVAVALSACNNSTASKPPAPPSKSAQYAAFNAWYNKYTGDYYKTVQDVVTFNESMNTGNASGAYSALLALGGAYSQLTFDGCPNGVVTSDIGKASLWDSKLVVSFGNSTYFTPQQQNVRDGFQAAVNQLSFAIGAAGGPGGAAPANNSSGVGATTVPPSTTPMSIPATSSECVTSQLSVTAVSEGAAAGHVSDVLRFTNTSSSPCSLLGYPGVAGLNSSGQQVVQAIRTLNGYFTNTQNGSDPPLVTLAPGYTASAILEGTDVPVGNASNCPFYPALLVTPPNAYQSVMVSVGIDGCSAIEIHPVVASSTGNTAPTPTTTTIPSASNQLLNWWVKSESSVNSLMGEQTGFENAEHGSANSELDRASLMVGDLNGLLNCPSLTVGSDLYHWDLIAAEAENVAAKIPNVSTAALNALNAKLNEATNRFTQDLNAQMGSSAG